MAFQIPFKLSRKLKAPAQDKQGIALFMVIAAVAMLAIVVTEFTYVAQVNARMIFDSADQVKAHYLAKTGLKISLLRLKAYQKVKSMTSGSNGFQVPAEVLNQIWSFPFIYPIPGDLPGMPLAAKEEIAKFTKESALEGSFNATIESESSKININSFLTSFQAPKKQDRNPGQPPPSSTPTSGQDAKFDATEAKKAFKELITQIIDQKFKEDLDFAEEYKDLNIEELIDNILGWVDYTHQPLNRSGKQIISYKRAPFYHISELKMIHPIDDKLYELLAPHFTTALTSGVNVNVIKEPLLKALFNVTDEEAKEFYKYRDGPEEPHKFTKLEDFWKWMIQNVSGVRSIGTEAKKIEEHFKKRGIVFIVDEETFRIRVTGEVNKATRQIEAWVQMSSTKAAEQPTEADPFEELSPTNPTSVSSANSSQKASLRITFMREL